MFKYTQSFKTIMKKLLFVISDYSDYRKKIFDDIISPRNKEFCNLHNYKYVEINDSTKLPNFRNHPSWLKYYIIRNLVNENKLTNDDIITYIDADQYFVSIENDLCGEKSISLSIDSGNTFCHSWNSLRINDWSKKHINNMLDDDLYNREINNYTKHPAFPNHSPSSFFASHMEQAAFYALCGIKRHSFESFWDLPNTGYHSDITKNTIYSIDEIDQNIQLFPTEYNVTEWVGESTCEFNINKLTDKNVVKIRHFAGGQSWDNIKNWIK